MELERHHSAWVVASVLTVASFIGATAYTQSRLTRLDSLASTLESDAIPSIELLSRTALALTRLGEILNQLAQGIAPTADTLGSANSEVRTIEDDVSTYARLAPLPGERELGAALRFEVSRAVDRVRTALGAEQASQAGDKPDWGDIDNALDAAVQAVVLALEHDVSQAELMAGDVRDVRASTQRIIIELEALATALALVGAAVAYRASRRHDELVKQHNSLLAARVTELDRFAGRLAHDVLSPLGTIAAALEVVAHSADAQARLYVDRAKRALNSAKNLVNGLLRFARSGARPEHGVTCSIDTVLADVVAECGENAAAADIELLVESDAGLRTSCAAGVVISIVQNLVRNAIRYMGPRSPRRIVVRCAASGARVRVEVEDTGPGIPAELQAKMFEPFVRGSHSADGGIGLGLATVKRLAEAHGGAVGVRSAVDVGTLFWVELPRAEEDAAVAERAQ